MVMLEPEQGYEPLMILLKFDTLGFAYVVTKSDHCRLLVVNIQYEQYI